MSSDPGESAPALINRADPALYQVKAEGKNRLSVHGADKQTRNSKSKVA